jgi:hypothetical protein
LANPDSAHRLAPEQVRRVGGEVADQAAHLQGLGLQIGVLQQVIFRQVVAGDQYRQLQAEVDPAAELPDRLRTTEPIELPSPGSTGLAGWCDGDGLLAGGQMVGPLRRQTAIWGSACSQLRLSR